MVSSNPIIGENPGPTGLSELPETSTSATPTPATAESDRPRLDPTRYGDWEKNGRCIDF